MNRIWLSDDPDSIDLPRGESALWIVSDRWPGILSAKRWTTRKQFMADPYRFLKPTSSLVLVGLVSALTTPSNRVKTGQFFTDPLPGVTRYSVDDMLFVTDPWRLWWHFGCVEAPFNDCFTSYRLESRWNRYVEGQEPNPCSKEILAKYGDGVIAAVAPFRFAKVNIRVVDLPEEVHVLYQIEKARAFNEEPTINKILKRLGKFADEVFQERCVPSYRDLFRSSQVNIVATDLGVDRFLVTWLRERIDLINFAAERFAV
jgi:hypothetical protein